MSICLTAAAAAAQKSAHDARAFHVERRACWLPVQFRVGSRADCMRAMLKCQLVCLCAVSRADFEYDGKRVFFLQNQDLQNMRKSNGKVAIAEDQTNLAINAILLLSKRNTYKQREFVGNQYARNRFGECSSREQDNEAQI